MMKNLLWKLAYYGGQDEQKASYSGILLGRIVMAMQYRSICPGEKDISACLKLFSDF